VAVAALLYYALEGRIQDVENLNLKFKTDVRLALLFPHHISVPVSHEAVKIIY